MNSPVIKKCISFSDVHWGLSRKNRKDDLKELMKNNLQEICSYTHNNELDAVFINGDLFDKHNVGYYAMNECREIISNFNVPKEMIFIIAGNHCLKNNTWELRKYSAVSIFLEDFGKPHEMVEQWHFGTPAPLDTKKEIIQIHQYIDEDNYMEFFEMFPNCKYLLTGDNHQHFIKRNKDQIMLNSGPIVRNKSNEVVTGFFDINIETGEIKVIPLKDDAPDVFRSTFEIARIEDEIREVNRSYLNSLQGIGIDKPVPYSDFMMENLTPNEYKVLDTIIKDLTE